jgi:hypothetical protein
MEQVIKLTGRIAKVFPANSGVSQRTGNQWMSQEYLLEFFSWSGANYPDRVVFRIFGEDRIKQFNLKELEDNVTVYLRMDAHESNGRWFNEISATNIVREGHRTAEASAPQSETQKQEETTNNGEKNDDLPF